MDDGQDHRSFLRGEVSFYLGDISAIIETVVGSTMPSANLKRGLMDGSTRVNGQLSTDVWTMVDYGQDRRPTIRGEASIFLGGISAIIEGLSACHTVGYIGGCDIQSPHSGLRSDRVALPRSGLQGYLAHKNAPPPPS